jgi:hypothetical protein
MRIHGIWNYPERHTVAEFTYCRVQFPSLTFPPTPNWGNKAEGCSIWGFHCDDYEDRSVFRLLVTANVVPSSPILVTLMMEALRSSEASILTRAARRNIPEDGILQDLENFFIRSELTKLSVWNTCNQSWKKLILGSLSNFIFHWRLFKYSSCKMFISRFILLWNCGVEGRMVLQAYLHNDGTK